MNISNLNCEYTGGGIYIITGKADDEWFLTGNDNDFLDIVDGDYHAIEWDGGDEDVNWYDTHYLRTPGYNEKREMFQAIFSGIVIKFDDKFLYNTLVSNWF